MLASLYLAAMIYFGDRVCSHFSRFISIQQRLATSFLVGLVLGLNPVWAVNILGILSLLALLNMIIAELDRSIRSESFSLAPDDHTLR